MNNDRLNFRVWDNQRKEFLPNNDFYLDYQGFLHLFEGKHRGEWSDERYVKEQFTSCFFNDGANDLIMLYENDLIKIDGVLHKIGFHPDFFPLLPLISMIIGLVWIL